MGNTTSRFLLTCMPGPSMRCLSTYCGCSYFSRTAVKWIKLPNGLFSTKCSGSEAAAMLLGVLIIPYCSSLTKLSLRALSLSQTLEYGIVLVYAWLSISEGIFAAMRSKEKSDVLSLSDVPGELNFHASWVGFVRAMPAWSATVKTDHAKTVQQKITVVVQVISRSWHLDNFCSAAHL